MKRLFMVSLLLLSLIFSSIVAFAQDDEMIDFAFDSSDASLSFPEDWEQDVDDDGVVLLSTDGVELMVYDAATVADVLDGDADAETAEALLDSVLDALPVDEDVELDAGDAKAVELEDRDVLRLVFEAEDSTGTVIVVPLADEMFGLVLMMLESDADEEISEQVDAIVASFDIAESEGSSAACTISTTEADTVQIRVGPGFNRTVIAFLPADVDFTAQGQTTDDDGNVWFRIPQEEAAPNKAVNETWVAADDVEQSGDCDDVEGAVAPPIIPIQQAPPTAAPQQSADTTTTDSGTDTTATDTTTTDAPSAPVVDASGAIIPNEGTWYLSYDIGSATCSTGSGTYDSGFGDETGTLSGGGSAGIFFNGLVPYVGNNTYEVAESFSSEIGTITGRFTMTITSPNTATGSVGFVIQDCNVFVPFTVNRIG